MADSETARRQTAAQWRERIERYSRSGLTRRAFCAQEGIGESTLGAWQRRLRNAAPFTPTQPSDEDDASALFTEVSLSGSPGEPHPAGPQVPCWDVELDLGEGVCLRIRRRPGC